MEHHPERIIIPLHNLMSLEDVCETLNTEPENYLTWVIRGEAPPLNVTVEEESFILHEDLMFWFETILNLKRNQLPEDLLALTLSVPEAATLLGFTTEDFVVKSSEGDAPTISTFEDGSTGVVRASLEVWVNSQI